MKKIAVFMMEVGGGHKMPALSIVDKIKKLDSNITINMYDIAKDLNAILFDKGVKLWWKYMLKFPFILKIMYRIGVNNHKIVQKFDKIISIDVEKKFIKFLEKEKPDLVFSTHCTAANIMGRLKQKGLKKNIKDILLITDAFEVHPIWVQGNSDYYILCEEKLVEKFEKWGVDKKKVIIKNFPLREQFSKEIISGLKRNVVLKKLNLKDKFSILIHAGGEGIGKIEKQIKKIFKNKLDVNVIAITGKNKKMYKKLLYLKEKELNKGNSNYKNLAILGFVTNMSEILYVSDVVLTKAGISSTLEALYMGKPVILTQCMENERGLKNFVIKNKAGWYEPDIKKQIKMLNTLLLKPEYYNTIVKNIENLNIKNGASEIAEFIISSLNK